MPAMWLSIFALFAYCALGQDLPVVRLSGFQEEDRVFSGPALYVIYKEFIVAEGATVTFDSSQSECKILFESYITVDGKLRLIGNDMAITRTNRSGGSAIVLKGLLEMLEGARVIDLTKYDKFVGWRRREHFVAHQCCKGAKSRIENAVFTDVSVQVGMIEDSSFVGTRFFRSYIQGSATEITNSFFSNSTIPYDDFPYSHYVKFVDCTFFNDSTIQSPYIYGSMIRTTFADSPYVFSGCPINYEITGCNFVGNQKIFPDGCDSLPNITASNLCGNDLIVNYAVGNKVVNWPNLYFATQDESVLSRLMSFSRYPIRWNPVATSFIANGAFNGVFENGISVQEYCDRPYTDLAGKIPRSKPRMVDEAKYSRSASYFAKIKTARS